MPDLAILDRAQRQYGERAYWLAVYAEHTGRRLDLDRLWREQQIPAGLIALMEHVMGGVQEAIVTLSAGANVTEWCKKPHAWDEIRALELLPGSALQAFVAGGEPFVPLRSLASGEPDQAEPGAGLDANDSERAVPG